MLALCCDINTDRTILESESNDHFLPTVWGNSDLFRVNLYLFFSAEYITISN